jgi:hypothetical protein
VARIVATRVRRVLTREPLTAAQARYGKPMSASLLPILILIAVAVLYVARTVAARRRGYPVGGTVVVRCRKGHLFTTIWVPGVSLKAVRLGGARFQHCPVGDHWSLVRPVRDADLTDEDRAIAARHRDVRIP